MDYKKASSRFERYLLQGALHRNGWNLQDAARELGLTRQAVHKAVRHHGLTPASRIMDPGAFIVPPRGRVKLTRRVVSFTPEEMVWMRSKAPLTYGQLVRAGLKLLRRLPDPRIRKLV